MFAAYSPDVLPNGMKDLLEIEYRYINNLVQQKYVEYSCLAGGNKKILII